MYTCIYRHMFIYIYKCISVRERDDKSLGKRAGQVVERIQNTDDDI